MLEKLPGFQCRYYSLQPAGGPEKDSSKEAKLAGFECIKMYGPKTNLDNAATIFADCESEDPGNNIFGWEKGLIERSCINYGKSLAAARNKAFFHLTLKVVNAWLLNEVLGGSLARFRTTAYMLLGEPEVGKSPLGKVLAMRFSEANVAESAPDGEVPALGSQAGYRICKSFEELRHEPGLREISELYDDGELEEQESVKTLTFVEDVEGQRV